MKPDRFTEEQVIRDLKEHELGAKTVDLCRKHGNNEATFYDWRNNFGRLEVSEAKRLMALETENAKLKRLSADAMLGNTALNDQPSRMVTPAVKREAGAHLRGAHEMSERRACRVVGCERVTVRYRSRRPVDPKLRDWLLALARERRRFGYRRLLIFLRREGFVLNHKPQANFPHLPRGLAARLQHRAAPFAHRLADAGRPCRPVLAATGPRRCARRWLRALARCRPPCMMSTAARLQHQLDDSWGQRQ